MDLFSVLHSVLMGLVEGLTEFIPVSSTGHLIITGDLLEITGETAKTFEVFIQLGAILAVCWFYRVRLSQVVCGLPSEPKARRFVLNLMIAVLPAAVLGLSLHKLIKHHLFQPLTVAFALIAGGVVMLLIERFARKPSIESIDQLGWKDALKLGIAQAVALFPGVSRSGATIMGGLAFGLSRQAATEFSFFLAIPTMLMATSYDLFKALPHLQLGDAQFFAIGFIVAFLSALAAVKGLLLYVANHNFRWFAYYRILFGAAVLFYFWV
ncbi:MAG: undecaprenyl-diphosphate phosphatase [Methylococcaceae bacterium]|nr:undecaprenyl-diphosphate phosphatase [Methylococcaceae bacterium]MCI0733825.1 undecaprenyl-diphosphate phosphatase [Methylococcaceae bacterium]